MPARAQAARRPRWHGAASRTQQPRSATGRSTSMQARPGGRPSCSSCDVLTQVDYKRGLKDLDPHVPASPSPSSRSSPL